MKPWACVRTFSIMLNINGNNNTIDNNDSDNDDANNNHIIDDGDYNYDNNTAWYWNTKS